MEDRIVLVGIIVRDRSKVAELDRLLSENQQYVIGRMGLPHHHGDSEIAIISIAMEAPQDVISSLQYCNFISAQLLKASTHDAPGKTSWAGLGS